MYFFASISLLHFTSPNSFHLKIRNLQEFTCINFVSILLLIFHKTFKCVVLRMTHSLWLTPSELILHCE